MKNYEVKFSGLSWNSSEYETTDGTLCAMVNLVPEDGALQPRQSPAWTPAGDHMPPYHEDLLYDLHVTQDTPYLVTVETELTSTLTRYLKAPNEPLPTRRTLIDRIFPHFYDSENSYATGATMVAAQAEAAIDREASRLGVGVFKHVSFGMVVLRLSDGSTTHYSDIFTLLPATYPTTIYVDPATRRLSCSASLHRHHITVTMRHPTSSAVRMVESAEVYLSRPVSFLDVRRALYQTVDEEGITTSLTFGALTPQATAELFERLQFYPSTTIDRCHFGQPVALQNVSAQTSPLLLDDLHRWCPFEIGMTYQYHTSEATERQSASGTTLDTLLEEEQVAGMRPDLYDQANGVRAEMVVRLSQTEDEAVESWYSCEVQYPLPGPLMVPHRQANTATLHLRVMAPDGDHYYTTTVYLRRMGGRGYRTAVFVPPGGVHRPSLPAFHSLLLQQARTLYLDRDSGEYVTSSWLWQTETAEEFALAQSKVVGPWQLPDTPSLSSLSAGGTTLGQGAYQPTPAGLMCTGQSAVRCVSEPLHGYPFDLSRLPHFSDLLATQTDIPPSAVRYAPFLSTFLPNCRLHFDTSVQRVYLRPNSEDALEGYALVYSLRSKQWGAVQTVAVDATDEVPILLCTNAMHLGKRHAPKRVYGVTLRGHFDDTFHQSHVGMALYGSNDLYHWRLIATSRNRYLSHLRGTPYRWFRVLIVGTLSEGESLEGLGFVIN